MQNFFEALSGSDSQISETVKSLATITTGLF